MLQQELPPCACGPTRYAGAGCGGRCAASAPAFSLLFPMPMSMGLPAEQCYYNHHAEDSGGGPVDCTLSLATPSTRRAQATGGVVHAGGAGAAVLVDEPRQQEGGSPPRRRCANCDTASTPLWRNGPQGPKSLCNACGIRHKKEERRAAAAVAPAPALATHEYACGGWARQPPPPPPQQQQWGCYGPKSAVSYGMYGGDGVVDADGTCLSWMFNVVPSSPAFAVGERHTLFQYY